MSLSQDWHSIPNQRSSIQYRTTAMLIFLRILTVEDSSSILAIRWLWSWIRTRCYWSLRRVVAAVLLAWRCHPPATSTGLWHTLAVRTIQWKLWLDRLRWQNKKVQGWSEGCLWNPDQSASSLQFPGSLGYQAINHIENGQFWFHRNNQCHTLNLSMTLRYLAQ